MYDNYPLFGTLTYRKEPECGLCKRDVQLWLKRVRKRFSLLGLPKFRYVVVGEYGKTTHRAHYHIIMWNVLRPDSHMYANRDIIDILDDEWTHGFTKFRMVNPCSDAAFRYTAKYMVKDCKLPRPDAAPTFMCSSIGKGGIGAPFIDKIKEDIRTTMNVDFKFLNRWTGKVETLQFNTYTLNRIFPSFCRTISPVFRQACVRCAENMHKFYNQLWFMLQREALESILNKCSDFFFVPSYDIAAAASSAMDYQEYHQLMHYVVQNADTIDLVRGRINDEMRHLFLAKLFEHAYSADLHREDAIKKMYLETPHPYEVF